MKTLKLKARRPVEGLARNSGIFEDSALELDRAGEPARKARAA
jgi:hypothetical protein